ncbi:MAG TPA: hypothetical protein VHG28_12975 [Longimicrobiaceae bacterium]|nr:hypothetical protein [Longimicrobiaceae bacterium]
MSNWRLTLFGDDDATPLAGTVLGEMVVEASCSTEPSHPRPFLLVPETLAESEVDLAEGSSVIGQVNVRVLDRRLVETDQRTGWLTRLLAVPGTGIGAGESALNGRRALLEQTDDGQSWFVVMDGIVGGVRLDDSLVTYSLEIRDARERERKVRAFLRADTATILPRGVLGGYGRYGIGWSGYTGWLVPPTQPMVGVYRRESTTQGRVDVSGMWRGKKRKDVPPALVVTPKILETIKAEATQVGKRRRFFKKPIIRYRNVYARVRLPWRYQGSGAAWNEIRSPVAYQWGSQGLIRTKRGPLSVSDEDRPVVTGVREVVLASIDATLPANGSRVEVIVAYNGPPSEDYPLHLEGMTAGELLKELYDGVYSVEPEDLDTTDGEPPLPPLKVRYDAAAVLALDTPVRARITEPVDDLREWVQEHVYKPLGAAPALDPHGRVSPIRYALPPVDRELTTLDDAVTAAGAGWEHAGSDAVNHVIVRYKRDFRIPLDDDPAGERSTGDGLSQVEATLERIHAPSVEALGDKSLELEMELFRAVGGVEGEAITGNVDSETAFALAMARADQALDRFVYGAQQVRARCRRPATAHLRVGDWVFVNLSWLPDYRTGRRGGARLAQIIAVKDLDPAWRELTLVDAGPANQAHPLFPTLGTPAATGDGVVEVPVTSIPVGGEARVEYAVADAVPAPGAGIWLPLERTPIPATLETPPLPSGARVWIRARTESQGARPSPYTNPISVQLPQVARLGEARLDVDPVTRAALVSWTPNDFARGVRVHWAIHDRDADPEFSGSVDVDGTLASVTLPIPAVPGRTLTVEAEPWTGWTGSAVTGTPGPRQRASWHLRAADAGKVRVSVETADDGATGTLTLTVADPEEWVTGVAFLVTDGAGGRAEEAADRTPSAGVYQKDVRLHPEHNVTVEPVVTLSDGSAIRPGSETFDRDHSANLVGRPQVSYDGDRATVAVTADGDAVSLHAQEWDGFAWTTPAELTSGNPFATGRRGSFTVAASTTGKRRLRVFAENATGHSGPAEEVEIDRYQIRSPVAAKFWATVDPATNRADLHLLVDGPAAVFPVTAQIFAQDPAGAPLPLRGDGKHVFDAPGQEIGPSSYPALNDIELPRTGSMRWWVKLSDAQGNLAAWAFASADRDRLPGGEVTPNDYSSRPSLVCNYDDDVSEVVVVVPGDRPDRPRRRTFAGLLGGGSVTYSVAVTPLDDGTLEDPFRVGEGAGRGAYRVEYRGGGRMEVLFSGPLHGVAPQPPACEPTVSLDASLRDRADVAVRVTSPVGERVGLEVKDSDAPGAPVWRWVAAPGSQTPAYADSGAMVGPEAEFFSEGLAGARKLDNLLLARDQVRRIWVRAVGEESGVPGAWTPVVLEAREQPWIESVDLTFDENTDELVLTAVGGAFCQSAELAVSDDMDLGANVRSVSAALAAGGRHTHRFALSAGERGRTWYARVTPFNGPNGAGLSGEPARDSEFVPASEQGALPPPITLTGRNTRIATTVTIAAAAGVGGREPLQWRHRTDDDWVGEGVWGPGAGDGWAAFTSPQTVSVARDFETPRLFVVQVRDADGRVGQASWIVPPAPPALGKGGRINPRVAYDDGDRAYTPYDAMVGRWHVDTLYHADGQLRPEIAVADPGYAPHALVDVSRRAEAGLTPYDPVYNSGGEIARNAPLARVASVLPDISYLDGRVATIAGTPVATVRDEAATGRRGVGADAENLVRNGGGQENGHGEAASGWSYGIGVALVTSTTYARDGDRSLALIHDSPNNSWSFQSFAVSAGDVVEVSGWIKVPMLAAVGGVALLNTVVSAGGSVTVLETSAPWVIGPDVGVPLDRTWDWTHVRSLYRVEANCTIDLRVQLGFGSPVWAYAYFDGVSLRRVARYPVEGRRRVDTLYGSDGVLRSAVAALDPGGVARDLGDAGRRAIGGLDASSYAVSQDVPLARMASVLPDISGSDGRVATLGGRDAFMVSRAQHGVFLETFENGAADVAAWNLRMGARPSSAVAEGQAGGKALRASGYTWMAFPQNIPFDPSKLYRIRTRVRQVTDPTTGGRGIWVGVEGVAADGVTLVNAAGTNQWDSQHYVAAAGAGLAAGAGWTDFTGFFKGWGSPLGYAPSATSPSPLHPNVRYFRPLFVLNYYQGNGTADIDYIAVDVMDEDLAQRGYRTIKPGGAALLRGVTADDPSGVARDLGDAGRRAIGGLDASSYAVSQNVPLARVAPVLPDISYLDGRVATIAGTPVATVRDEAKLGRTSAGEDPENLLVNGGGQLDPVTNNPYGPMATGWTLLGYGFPLTTYDETPKFGDRVLCIHHKQYGYSGGYQSIYCHAAGEVWEVTGFIRVAQVYGAGGHALVHVEVVSGGQILSTEGPSTGGTWAGLPCDTASDWRPVRIVFRPGVGWNNIYLLQGLTANAYARTLYDGFVVRKLGAPQLRAISALNASNELVTGVGAGAHVAGRTAATVRDEAYEGNRKGNVLMPYGDRYLRENLQVYDPSGAWRDLTDVSRRSQVGLAYANPDGSGGEIARNAPLARIAPVLPDISASDGRVATIAGTPVATVRDEAYEGNRKATYVMPHGDGYLRENLLVHHPNVAWRNLTDVSARSQEGIESDYTVRRTVPLARLSPSIPGIDPGTGRINRSVAASDGTTLENTAGAADKVSRLRNLVNNPSATQTLDRWSNPGGMALFWGSGAPFPSGTYFVVHQLYSAGSGDNKITYSDWFEIDPDKCYEITWYQAASVFSGSDYFGVHTRDTHWNDPGIDTLYVDQVGVASAGDTNPYFWWGQNPGDRYMKHVAYVLAAGTPTEHSVGAGENIYRNMRFRSNTRHLQLRYLNYYNHTAKYLYTGHIRVVETTPEAIEATRRTLGALDVNRRIASHRATYPVMAYDRSASRQSNPISATTDYYGYSTISIAAHTTYFPWGNIAYNGGTISGVYGQSTYYVYTRDPNFAGGAVTYYATTDPATLSNDPNNYYVGYVVTPAAGQPPSSGGGGGGGCVEVESYLREGLRAGDLVPGDRVEAWVEGTDDTVVHTPVQIVYPPKRVRCVRLTSRSGISLVVGWNTPLTLRDGTETIADRAEGVRLLVDDRGELRWEEVTVSPAGYRDVVLIGIGGGVYAAGERPDRRIFTHNAMTAKQ